MRYQSTITITIKPLNRVGKATMQSGQFTSRQVCVRVTERMVQMLRRRNVRNLPVVIEYDVQAVN